MLIVLLCALLLDYFFAEPQKYHPLSGFANLAEGLEQKLNDLHVEHSSEQKRAKGLVAVLVCLLPAWWLSDFIITDNIFGLMFEIIIVYFALGLRNLKEQCNKIVETLRNEQEQQAQTNLAVLIKRDTEQMDAHSISRITTEYVLHKGNDDVLAALFWFIVAGAPGVVVYRLTRTLDGMWGGKDERFKDFGFVVAKLDALLNYVPARLTAFTYALMGNWKNATKCSSSQGAIWESSNSGVVMAAGAGALDVQLGGDVQYHEEYQERPELGCGTKADHESITQACQLVNRSTVLWISFVAIISLVNWI